MKKYKVLCTGNSYNGNKVIKIEDCRPVREVVGEFGLLSVPFVHSCVDTPLFLSWLYCDHGVYVFATEARGSTVIVELRRYNQSKKLQNCIVIRGFVVIDASLYPIFFACFVVAGQTFGHNSVAISGSSL